MDLNDGKLQEKYSKFLNQFQFVKGIGLGDQYNRMHLKKDMSVCIKQLSSVVAFSHL